MEVLSVTQSSTVLGREGAPSHRRSSVLCMMVEVSARRRAAGSSTVERCLRVVVAALIDRR